MALGLNGSTCGTVGQWVALGIGAPPVPIPVRHPNRRSSFAIDSLAATIELIADGNQSSRQSPLMHGALFRAAVRVRMQQLLRLPHAAKKGGCAALSATRPGESAGMQWHFAAGVHLS
jgi:hypothetical protein